MQQSSLQKSVYKSEAQYQETYKIIIIGDSTVGKTSYIRRLVKNEFNHTTPTIGVAYENKLIYLKECTVKLQIWDTAGSEKYKSITTAHYRKAMGAILMFDILDKHTFHHASSWLQDIKDHAGEDVIIMLIANKLDALSTLNFNQNHITQEEIRSFCQKNQLLYQEVSAKSGLNVKNSIQQLVETIYKKNLNNQSQNKSSNQQNNQLYDSKKNNNNDCC